MGAIHELFVLALSLVWFAGGDSFFSWVLQTDISPLEEGGESVVKLVGVYETPYGLLFRREFCWVLHVRVAPGVNTEFPY